MKKGNLIFKSIITIVFLLTFCLPGGVYSLTIFKFFGDQTEAEKMIAIENISPQTERKAGLEELISDPSANTRYNVAGMLAEIGDSQSLSPLLVQIEKETNREVKNQQIQAVYAIKFRQAVLTGGNLENELLSFFSLNYYPLKTGEPSGEPYGATRYILYQLAFIGSQNLRTQINKILELSKAQDLGSLPEDCQRALYILDKFQIPQRYVAGLKSGDLGLRYRAARELSKRAKTEILTADNKTVIDLLKEQLFFAETNGYDDYYNYINNILKNNFGETVDYVEPCDVYKNQAPVINPIADVSVFEGQSLTVNIVVSDPDGGLPKVAPYLTIQPLPKGANLSGNTFRWTTSIGQSGDYQMTVYARDELEGISSEKFTINVQDLPAKSILKNTSTNSLTGIILMVIQKLVETDWRNQEVVVVDTSFRTVEPGEQVNLKKIWNEKNYTIEETGKYRIYGVFANEEGEILFYDTCEFNVLSGTQPLVSQESTTKTEGLSGLQEILKKIQDTIYRFYKIITQPSEGLLWE